MKNLTEGLLIICGLLLLSGCGQTTQSGNPAANKGTGTPYSNATDSKVVTTVPADSKTDVEQKVVADKLTAEDFVVEAAAKEPAAPSQEELALNRTDFKKWQLDQFKNADVNRDGYVDRDEVIGFIKRENQRKGTNENPQGAAGWWMKLKDLNGDGVLSLPEFHYWKKKG